MTSAWRRVGCLLLALALAGPTALPAQDTPAGLSWKPVAVTGAAITIALFVDQPVARQVHPHRESLAGAARDLSRFGEVGVSVPIAGALLLTGLVTRRPALVRTAARTAVAIAGSAVAVEFLKQVIGRQRPFQDPDLDGGVLRPFSGYTSMPSGHTTAAFALATTLGDAIDRPLPRVLLYGAATGTAVGRVIGEHHWVSDVIAAAGIGILSGKLVDGRVSLFGLAPRILVGPKSVGIQLR